MEEQKSDYKQKKELIELKHKYKMEELAYERENNKLFHENELTRIRIKSAEIKRTQERGNFSRYSR